MPVAAGHGVGAGAADQPVVADTAKEAVIAGAAVDRIGAIARRDTRNEPIDRTCQGHHVQIAGLVGPERRDLLKIGANHLSCALDRILRSPFTMRSVMSRPVTKSAKK